MTNNDPIAEARRDSNPHDIKWVLLMYEKYKDSADPAVAELREALRNLLSHVERLTAPVTGDRAELVEWHKERAEEYADEGLNDTARHHRQSAAMLEADARREVALAEAIREIEQLPSARSDYESCISSDAVLAILAKVSAEDQP